MERQEGAGKSARLTFSQKWGDDPFTQTGHTQVPNALIVYAHRLGLRSEECWLITCILRYKYDASNPTPSQQELATLFGQSVDTVQRTVKKIVTKKLLKVEHVRDEDTHRFTHTIYDFTPLRFALNECYYQEHPDERPQMPISLEKARPQNCGLDTPTHTADLRPGFEREPHRRSAAWATPQICGLHTKDTKNLNVQEVRALNVRAGGHGKPTVQRSTHNEGTAGINAVGEKAVAEVVALTGDEGSQRRFRQLWEVAERGNALSAWEAALQALRSRKTPPARPGAYFAKVCVQELEKRGAFVPTIAEKITEGDVGELVARSLENSAPVNSPEITPEIAGVDSVSEKPGSGPLWAAERGSAGVSESSPEFVAFVVAERAKYAAELAGVKESTRERLLAAFDRPEKRREMYGKWSASPS